jgi:hypothetical protein
MAPSMSTLVDKMSILNLDGLLHGQSAAYVAHRNLLLANPIIIPAMKGRHKRFCLVNVIPAALGYIITIHDGSQEYSIPLGSEDNTLRNLFCLIVAPAVVVAMGTSRVGSESDCSSSGSPYSPSFSPVSPYTRTATPYDSEYDSEGASVRSSSVVTVKAPSPPIKTVKLEPMDTSPVPQITNHSDQVRYQQLPITNDMILALQENSNFKSITFYSPVPGDQESIAPLEPLIVRSPSPLRPSVARAMRATAVIKKRTRDSCEPSALPPAPRQKRFKISKAVCLRCGHRRAPSHLHSTLTDNECPICGFRQ